MKIINLDSQLLKSIQTCARKTQYQFRENLLHDSPKDEALDNGSLMHLMLENYYQSRMNNLDWKETVRKSIELGNEFGAKSSLGIEEIEQCIYQFTEYAKYYQHDQWSPLAIEEVGTKNLYQDNEIQIIYTFKVDMIAEQGSLVMPWDHKTCKQNRDINTLDDQFIGYCWGLDMNRILINQIGFQKSKAPNERFQRHVLEYTDEQIEEWRLNTIEWALEYLTWIEKDQWKTNWTSCVKYNKDCKYKPICKTPKSNREWVIGREYKMNDSWDPSSVLGNELVQIREHND